MTGESGVGPWMFMDVILVVILGAALVYGVVMWSRRRGGAAAERVRDRGTERVYRETEQQDRKELPS